LVGGANFFSFKTSIPGGLALKLFDHSRCTLQRCRISSTNRVEFLLLHRSRRLAPPSNFYGAVAVAFAFQFFYATAELLIDRHVLMSLHAVVLYFLAYYRKIRIASDLQCYQLVRGSSSLNCGAARVPVMYDCRRVNHHRAPADRSVY